MTYVRDPRVDGYIDALQPWQQAICRQVRDLVHRTDPEVEETIKRTDHPYFVLQGNICALLASGRTEDVLTNAKHPYTQLLLQAVPDPRAPLSVDAAEDTGEPPRNINPTEGCRFRWRCPLAIEVCSEVTPQLRVLGAGHTAACHVAQADENLASKSDDAPPPDELTEAR